jgi:hypothetical protein
MSYEKALALIEKSVSRPTLFSLRFPQSLGIAGGGLSFQTNSGVSDKANEYIEYFCKDAFVPDVRLETTIALGQEHMNIAREQPTSMIYGKPLTITIIENSDFLAYNAMRRWIDLTTVNANQERGLRSQRMNYYHSYVGDIELTKLEQPDTTGDDDIEYKKPLRVRFINAYPIQVGQITLNTEQQDTATTFVTSFTYESYTIETEENELLR